MFELHGKQASKFDLLITYSAAVLYTVAVLFLARDMPLPVIKIIALGIISFDIGGGVIANFTEGTTNYYVENQKLRYRFIAMHITQPLILLWIFPSELLNIAIVSVYTLSCMVVMDIKSGYPRKMIVSSLLTIIGLILSFALNLSQPIVHITLIMYIFKLVMAFPVRWE